LRRTSRVEILHRKLRSLGCQASVGLQFSSGSSAKVKEGFIPKGMSGRTRFVLSFASVSSSARVDLTVQIGALRLRNPVLAASGTFGYGLEFAHLVDFQKIGGFVTKGISMEPIEGAPAPRLCDTPSGMLNAVGLQNVGVEAFVTGKLPLLRKYNTTVVVNVFGYCIEEYVSVIERLESAEGIAAYELNISCPNVKKGGMQFGSNPALVEEVVRAAKAVAVKRPLWVKLMPLVTDIGLIAKTAEAAGADALTVANTYPAMSIEPRTGKSRLGNLTGGLSGPAIRPITVRLVWEARKAVKIPIIGLGGIEKVDDIVEYLAVGASAVQVGTASFTDPKISEGLAEGLAKAMREFNALNISDLRDTLEVKIG
jgi:dihydroorotate dehydrogenase (NAD+) catalytic subunit